MTGSNFGTHLEDSGKIQHFTQNGEVGVDHVGDENGNGVGINSKIHGNGVDQDRDDGTTTRAGKDHVDKSVHKGGLGINIGKHLASV